MERPIETEGKIVAVLPGTMFRVALANEHLVLAHMSGKMRKRFIRLTTGDLVKLEISPYGAHVPPQIPEERTIPFSSAPLVKEQACYSSMAPRIRSLSSSTTASCP